MSLIHKREISEFGNSVQAVVHTLKIYIYIFSMIGPPRSKNKNLLYALKINNIRCCSLFLLIIPYTYGLKAYFFEGTSYEAHNLHVRAGKPPGASL